MTTSAISRRTRAWRWLPSAVLLGIVVMFATGLPWTTVLASLRGASLPLVGLAMFSTVLAVTARALLFWRLLRRIGVTSVGLATRATFTAAALNSMLVGQAGEAGRVLLVVRGTRHSSAEIIATVVFEHAMVSTIYLVLLLSAGVLLPKPESLAHWRVPALIALATLGGALLLLAHARGTGRSGELGRASGLLRQLTRVADAFLNTLRRLVAGGHISGALSMAAIYWGLQLFAFYATTVALGCPMPPAATVIGFLAVSASGSVRLTPGNVGVAQVVFAGAAGLYGVPMQEAVAVAMLWQVIQTVPTVIVALVFAPLSSRMPRPVGMLHRAPVQMRVSAMPGE
jgi:uncharacterized membrane protein YbhN (UPF0104 family)